MSQEESTVRIGDLESLVKRQAAEINRRRGAMSVARDLLKENGETEGTLYQRIERLLIYKRAMESMASQFIHPKTTALEMARQQLGLNK